MTEHELDLFILGQFIKDNRLQRLCYIVCFVCFAIVCLGYCCLQKWILSFLYLIASSIYLYLVCKVTDDLKKAYAKKKRIEFCIEQLGWDDEKA